MAILQQTVSFVHPALAGLAAAMGLIPIVIHLVNRRRYRPVTWAAMSFLLAARARSKKRIGLENWLLMLARVALIVLLGLAVARPYIPSSTFSPFRSTQVHRILVIDDSLSMGAVDVAGRTRFYRARDYAGRLIASFSESDPVSIVTVGAPATALLLRPVYDRRLVRDVLLGIHLTQKSSDMLGALAKALEITNASETALGNRAVYIVSDFPRDLWASETGTNSTDVGDAPGATVLAARRLADALANPSVDLNLVRVAAGSIENISVGDLSLDSALHATGTPIRLTARVTNFGEKSARELILQVRQDDRIIRREPLPTIGPGESKLTSMSIQFAVPGTHTLEAKVISQVADVLSYDDARYLSVEVNDSVPILIVDGQPGATLLAGEAGYLATALAPRTSPTTRSGTRESSNPQTGEMLIRPKIISSPELEGEVLSDYDVLALCNVARLSAAQWAYVKSFVSDGGGLLVFVGDLVSPDNYNRMAYAEGKGLLPVKFSAAPIASDPDGAHLGFTLASRDHQITSEFTELAKSGLFLARVDMYLPVEPDPGRTTTILSYTDGAPALLSSEFGRGRVVLCNTTANMDWTNLPAKGDYVSLMLNTISYLAPHHGRHRNVLVGESVVEPLSPLQSSLSLRVLTKEGTKDGRVVSLNNQLGLEFGPVQSAGVFAMSLGSEIRNFAANVDPAESALSSAEEGGIRKTLDRPMTFTEGDSFQVTPSTTGRSTEMATLTAWIVLGFLFVEMCMAMLFGSYRNQEAPGVPVARRAKGS